ncbi:MAG TPA: cytochrome b/b6 domain-containing protein [Stellaceae bacterium]|nr:cytochrome b/b6 domain-containing protein [Stellaceae bacterium]
MAEAGAASETLQDAPYNALARACHWLTVALLSAIIPLGLVMGDLPRGLLQDTLFVTHESLGLTVLGLTLLRLLWRLARPAPPPSSALTPLERRASGGVHALLYLLLFLMPVTGYLFVAFSGIELRYLGLIPVPLLVAKAKPPADLALAIHASLQWAIYGLAALHIGAALYHHFRRRNDVLGRMLPALRRR